jgi:hypothetical protein
MAAVSIIIPTYNHAHYLPHAIQSVEVQSLTDWEAIIVDDGSTDNPQAVIAQFTDPRLRYIFQENQGLSAARNTGIRAAQGTYLAFLDADDEWEPEFLRCCVDVLASDGALGGVYTRNYFIDDQSNVLPQLGGHVVPRAEFRSWNLMDGFFPPNAALIRAGVLDNVGVFDVGLSGEADWDFWIRISDHYEMQGIPKALARYRVYPGSMSTDVVHMHSDRIAVLTKHFGPPQGDPSTWFEEKRCVYGFAYRSAARGYLQQNEPEEGWRFLAQAAATWPPLLERLDTFYELAIGDQPRGYRGQVDLLDLESNGAKMLKGLDFVFADAGSTLEAVRRSAYTYAYLALSILSDQAGHWPTIFLAYIQG